MENNIETIKRLENLKKSLEKKREDAIKDININILNVSATIDLLKGIEVKSGTSAPLVINRKVEVLTDTLRATILKLVTEQITKFESADFLTDYLIEHYYPKKDKQKFRAQVSNLLSWWKVKGNTASYQYSSSKKDTLWGRKEWINGDGKPKEGVFAHPLLNLVELL